MQFTSPTILQACLRLVALAIALAVFSIGNAKAAQISLPFNGNGSQPIAVRLDATHLRPLPSHFYGANGQARNTFNWDDPAFQTALSGLRLGILRFPAGTGANYWDWKSGEFILNYDDGYSSSRNAYPSPLSELATEISVSHAAPLFVLNMLTDPTCVPPSGGYCSFTLGSPNLDHQLQMLAAALAMGIDLRYLELGNEYFLSNMPGYTSVYPNPANSSQPLASVVYGRLATQWIATIKQRYPNAKIAAVGANITGSPSQPARVARWLSGLFDPAQNSTSVGGNGQAALEGADAVTLHLYQGSNLPPGATVDTTTAEDMLGQPFKTWNAVKTYDLPLIPPRMSIWFTEYNLKDQRVADYGTWAHGLYMATLSLLFLEDDRVQMAIHHDIVGGAIYGDLFSSTTGFAAASPWTPPSPPPPPTTLYGKSATADALGVIGEAVAGAKQAERLSFTNAPAISDSGHTITYPALYGWDFSAGSAAALSS